MTFTKLFGRRECLAGDVGCCRRWTLIPYILCRLGIEVKVRKLLCGATVASAGTGRIIPVIAIAALSTASLWVSFCYGSIRYDAQRREWTLQSSSVVCRLRNQGGSVYLGYFGPAGGPAWPSTPPPYGPRLHPATRGDLTGMAEGQSLSPEDLKLVSQEIHSIHPGADQLTLTFQHRRLPLRIIAKYTAWASTGVLTRQLIVVNTGHSALHIESLPSLSWNLPGGRYQLTYLWGGWSHERQVITEELGPGRRTFIDPRGRSTNGYSPWFCLNNEDLGLRYLAQLAYSGNWAMRFERYPSGPDISAEALNVSLGMRFDFGGPLTVLPGESFLLPSVAFTATAGDSDDAANQLHRYQRQFVVPRTPTNDPLLVQFNSWYPFQGKMNVREMKRCADVAAQLGAEVFVLDAGWFSGKNWSRELGDWTVNRAEFPHGLQELANYVRSEGMEFGLWVEIENLGVDSRMFRKHPDWCLACNGHPLEVDDRYQLDFAKPEVRRWARSVIDGFVRNYGIEWLKIDYNIDIGERFDPPSLLARRGDVLYQQIMYYYKWLDEIRAAYPKLVIENCSSGGLRLDLGVIAHTHTTWLSDEVRPLPSVQLAYGCTLEFMPEICNHWMVGDTLNGEVGSSEPAGWWDFMLRVPMTGQFGISSRVFSWSPALERRAEENVSLYKRLRAVVMGADVYHLTPPPAHDEPKGWCAIQYVSQNQKRSIVMVYRLAESLPAEAFKLRGLAMNRTYRVLMNGAPLGTSDGLALSTKGLEVQLGNAWRAAVVELNELP